MHKIAYRHFMTYIVYIMKVIGKTSIAMFL